MTEEQKQKIRDYQREYHKKYYAAKKLNNRNKNLIKAYKIIAIIHKILKIIYHIKNYKRA